MHTHNKYTWDTDEQTRLSLVWWRRGSEFPLGEQNRSQKRPDEQTCSCPTSHNPHPHRWPPNVNQLPALPNWGCPPCQKHCRVHTSKREDDVEKRIWIWYWLRLLFFFMFVCLVQWKQRLSSTFTKQEIYTQNKEY